MAFPALTVRAYPSAEAAATLSSISTNASEQNPERPSPIIPFTATAVPERPPPVTESETRANTDVTVPMLAVIEMNLAGSLSLPKADAMVAPTVAVIPGNHPAMSPVTTPLSPGPTPTGSLPSSLCSGRHPSFGASRRGGTPNSPERSGKRRVPSPRGPVEEIPMSIAAYPSSPEASRRRSATSLRLAERTTTAIAKITTPMVTASRIPTPPRSIIHCIGIASASAAAAPTALPMAAALTAAIPLPSRRRRWPGRTETASSSLGAPMNTDGTKSTNECTEAADMMMQPANTASMPSGTAHGSAEAIAGASAARTVAAAFTWIPGTIPVNVPMAAPIRAAAATMTNSSGPTGRRRPERIRARQGEVSPFGRARRRRARRRRRRGPCTSRAPRSRPRPSRRPRPCPPAPPRPRSLPRCRP